MSGKNSVACQNVQAYGAPGRCGQPSEYGRGHVCGAEEGEDTDGRPEEGRGQTHDQCPLRDDQDSPRGP
jgi:hypothetical protein